MANEDLMNYLPENFERVPIKGIFNIRNNGGSYSVTCQWYSILTCGGEHAKEDATNIACSLNRVMHRKIRSIQK